MGTLIQGVIGASQGPGHIVMISTSGLLMYLEIKKEYESTLLAPMGLGTILVNFPNSDVLSAGGKPDLFNVLFDFGIKTELFPLLLFIGIGVMIDSGPLLQNPFMLMSGAATQPGILFTIIMAVLLGSDSSDAASIGIIGVTDGPTSIFVANILHSKYMGAIMAVVYSYTALVPTIQPVAIKAVTTKAERQIRTTYRAGEVSQTAKIPFLVVITAVAGLIAPVLLPLVGFLMFGSLSGECDVLDRLSITAWNELVNIISILLRLPIFVSMNCAEFLGVDMLMVTGLGLVAFIMDSVGGMLFVKFSNLSRKEGVNPMIGAAGISTFPMSNRVIQEVATDEDPQSFILMHAAGANISGQIASVITGGLLSAFLTQDGKKNEYMSVNMEDLRIVSELLDFGWGGVFVVLSIIYLTSKLLTKLFPIKK